MEFRFLTGARPSEANMFGRDNVDLERGEIWLQTLKKRDGKLHKRYFSIPTLGPRFQRLLARLNPHPVTGLYFHNSNGKPHQLDYIARKFKAAAELAGLTNGVIPYDVRGTFAMHRAIVVKGFRQLQSEMGHGSPMSIQSYLDEASRFRKEESIFWSKEGQSVDLESAESAHKSAHFCSDIASEVIASVSK